MKIGRNKTPPPRQRLRSDETQGPSAFSYHARRSDQEVTTGRQLQREALRARGKRFGTFWVQRFGLVTLLCVVLLLAIIALNLSTSVKVVSTGSASNDFLLQDKVVYETAAHKLLAKSIWNRNKLTVDTDKASAELAKQFPELSAVSITLPLLANKPVVHVQPAQPALILAAHNGSYVVDTSGKVLLMSANVPKNSNLQLPTVTDQSNFTAVINRQALTEGDVRFIQIVVAQLTAKGNRVASLMLPSGASELDVHLVGQPYFVKFNLERNEAARQQAGTFLATQAQLKKQNITPAQYVDVRVEGRAYYK